MVLQWGCISLQLPAAMNLHHCSNLMQSDVLALQEITLAPEDAAHTDVQTLTLTCNVCQQAAAGPQRSSYFFVVTTARQICNLNHARQPLSRLSFRHAIGLLHSCCEAESLLTPLVVRGLSPVCWHDNSLIFTILVLPVL